jgi:hypothetical protein
MTDNTENIDDIIPNPGDITINNTEDLLRVFMSQFSQLNSHNLNPNYIETVLQRSFEEDTVNVQRCTQEFIDSLDINDRADEEYTCSICMEQIKPGDKYVSLPCTEVSHRFHECGANSECAGIKKWLEMNNSCPICRTKFPGEDVISVPDESPTEPNDEPQEIEMTFSVEHDASQAQNIIHMISETLQNIQVMEEEQMLQQAIENSLNSPTVES